ncbi:MAG: hypothetical protein IT238_11530 [Bacteroidia bacterium]|nr:hypothetical protein [Bacteroidia bacterium]MCZ2249201.1 hypothetical protein [Bacteroidia bacterium]
MSNRVQLSSDRKTLEIPSITDTTKFKILMVWFVLWTISGIVVFSQFFTNSSREEKMWYAIWMAFWAFFEYKASVLMTWRRNGKEIFLFNENGFVYRRDVNGRGIDKIYNSKLISNLRVVNFKDRKVQARVQPYYWSMGAETVFFTYENKDEAVGLQLTEDEALQLLKIMKNRLNKP